MIFQIILKYDFGFIIVFNRGIFLIQVFQMIKEFNLKGSTTQCLPARQSRCSGCGAPQALAWRDGFFYRRRAREEAPAAL
jgi:hypothetical protein